MALSRLSLQEAPRLAEQLWGHWRRGTTSHSTLGPSWGVNISVTFGVCEFENSYFHALHFDEQKEDPPPALDFRFGGVRSVREAPWQKSSRRQRFVHGAS